MGETDLKRFLACYKEARDLVSARLDELSDYFSYAKPNSSYFVFPRMLNNQMNSWELALDLLDKAQVAVVPGSAFGPGGENHIRINFGRNKQDINIAFDRINKYFAVK
jgi:aspartate/methionine/tyrosine aminotransferase